MPETGRPAADSGNRYQDLVVTLYAIDLLLDPAQVELWPEPPGAGALDLKLTAETGETYAEIKELAPGGGQWTAAALQSEGVLDAFLEQLERTPHARMLLITGAGAADLKEGSRRYQDAARNQPENLHGAAQELLRQRSSRRVSAFVDALCRMPDRSEDEVYKLLFTSMCVTTSDPPRTLRSVGGNS